MRRILGGMTSVAVVAAVGCGGGDTPYARLGEVTFTCNGSLFAAGDRVYFGQGFVDVSDPTNPTVVSSNFLPIPFAADGTSLWTRDGNTINEVDATDIDNPVTVQSFDLGIEVDGFVKIVVTETAIAVLDIGLGASNLYVLDRDAPEVDGVAAVAGMVRVPGAPATLAARGDLVVIAGSAGAVVYDLGDPYRPRRAGELRSELFLEDGGDLYRWAAFHDDRVVAITSGRIALAPVAEDGAVGEITAHFTNREASDLGVGIAAFGGDLVLSQGDGNFDSTLYRLGDDDITELGSVDPFCAATGGDEHVYVHQFGDRFQVWRGQ